MVILTADSVCRTTLVIPLIAVTVRLTLTVIDVPLIRAESISPQSNSLPC